MPILTAVLVGCFKTVEPVTTIDRITEPGRFPWELYDQAFADTVDDGLIDYRTLQQDSEDLNRFIAHVAAVSPASDPSLFPTEDAELAYWLNAYNALAVRGVLDRPELETVDAQKVEFFYGTRYRMGDDKVSLYKLENGIIRERYGDPRIHFVLNCQAVSCPTFPNTAIRPDELDQRLDQATRAFVHDPAHVEVRADGVVEVSSLFKWYAVDFGGEEGIVPWIHQHNEAVPKDAPVAFKDYDWTLLAQDGRRPQ